MIRVRYLGIHRNDREPPLELCHENNLEGLGFFAKPSAAQLMSVIGGGLSSEVKPGKAARVEKQGQFVHIYAHRGGFCGVMMTDEEYPHEVAEALLRKITDEFMAEYPRSAWNDVTAPNSLPLPQLKEYITKYQDPYDADNIMKIQRELNEVKAMAHSSIVKVLERGEKIDNLVAKSDVLSAQSKMFYTQAKKQNSCCVVM